VMNMSFSAVGSTCRHHRQPTISAVQTLLEQGSGRTNEDILLQDGNLYGVFDGATSLGKSVPVQGKTGGKLAAEIAAKTFSCNGDTLSRLGCLANRNIRQLMESSGVDIKYRQNVWSTSAAIVRIDGDELEWFQVGDSLALALYENGSHSLLTEPINHDRDTLSLWKEIGPISTGTIQENLADQILKVREGMNIHYGVMNGEPKALDFFQHGRISLAGVTDIIVFTDGLFLPQADPDQPADMETFVHLYHQGGLPLIHRLIRGIQKGDPRCLNYPRFKKHDDIAAIALSFHEA